MAISADDIKEILKKASPQLFLKPNVVATAIGYKHVQGKRTAGLCIVCSVESKVPVSFLSEKELIPRDIEGIPTDVQQTGAIYSLALPTGRFRPAPGGVSIGHTGITAGTLGCLVNRGGKLFILSNNHVLANSNQAEKGDLILQPGPHDGGEITNDQIARLSDFIPIKFENEQQRCLFTKAYTGMFNYIARLTGSKTRIYSIYSAGETNLSDCAIAEPFSEGDVVNEILDIGTITDIAKGELDTIIKKSGRTTGLTEGVIEQTDATVRVNFGAGKTALFTDQLIAGPMSQGGDSGSVIVTTDNDLVGLLFAGSTTSTIINRIENVFSQLDVSLP